MDEYLFEIGILSGKLVHVKLDRFIELLIILFGFADFSSLVQAEENILSAYFEVPPFCL
jgi:hypothetical protein